MERASGTNGTKKPNPGRKRLGAPDLAGLLLEQIGSVEDQESKARAKSKQQNGLRTENEVQRSCARGKAHTGIWPECSVQGLIRDLCAEAQREDKSERKTRVKNSKQESPFLLSNLGFPHRTYEQIKPEPRPGRQTQGKTRIGQQKRPGTKQKTPSGNQQQGIKANKNLACLSCTCAN
jgi:hypothetical protein